MIGAGVVRNIVRERRYGELPVDLPPEQLALPLTPEHDDAGNGVPMLRRLWDHSLQPCTYCVSGVCSPTNARS